MGTPRIAGRFFGAARRSVGKSESPFPLFQRGNSNGSDGNSGSYDGSGNDGGGQDNTEHEPLPPLKKGLAPA
ncbi:hypothetical protein [Lysobacter gummosus]|uniref:hypothetical protein n=1 Tax=Lysobacter gummosus TaxID=262324 RepID=UPI00362F007C